MTSTQRNTSEGTPHTQTLTILGDTDHTFGDRTTSERSSIGACFPATGVPFGILGEGFFALLGLRDSKPFLVRFLLTFLPALLPTCCLACSYVGCCPNLLYSSSYARLIQPGLSTWLPQMNSLWLPVRTPNRTPIRSVSWLCPAPKVEWVRRRWGLPP